MRSICCLTLEAAYLSIAIVPSDYASTPRLTLTGVGVEKLIPAKFAKTKLR
jgi:hypothetical protein